MKTASETRAGPSITPRTGRLDGHPALRQLSHQRLDVRKHLRLQTEFAAAGDVGGDVVGVETLLGFAVDRFEGGFVHQGFGLDRAELVRQDELVEVIENVALLAEPLNVPAAGDRSHTK